MELKENDCITSRKRLTPLIRDYINTPKQLILDFYDCKNDNFQIIVIVLLLLFCCFFWLKNKLWVHPQSIFEQKSVKECIPLSEPKSFFIKVWYIRWSKLYERVFMIKRFKKNTCIAIKFN